MSKINDQPMDQEELEEVSGGEDSAYEAPEVTKVEFDDTDRDIETTPKGIIVDMFYDLGHCTDVKRS